MEGKIANTKKTSSIGASTIYSSGVYYGGVVDIDDDRDEGRIRVHLQMFDKKSLIKCKDITPTSLQTNNVNLNRLQGFSELNKSKFSFDLLSEIGTKITDQQQVDKLTTNKRVGNKELTNDPCTGVPWAVPLLPKHLQVMPKVGEMCLVIVENVNKDQQNRYWIGPLMSDKSRLAWESEETGGGNLNSNVYPKSKVSNIPEGESLTKRGDFTGGFPEKLDVAIMGRNNADIVLPTRKDGADSLSRGGEVLIRAGKFNFTDKISPSELSLNTTNPGFLRIKVVSEGVDRSREENLKPLERLTTHSMLYSDYISLVSYKNTGGQYATLKNINPLLEKDKDINGFHTALSPLIRGDRLIKFLELLVDYVKNHNHPYHKHTATNANSKPELEKFPLASLISPHIRIN